MLVLLSRAHLVFIDRGVLEETQSTFYPCGPWNDNRWIILPYWQPYLKSVPIAFRPSEIYGKFVYKVSPWQLAHFSWHFCEFVCVNLHLSPLGCLGRPTAFGSWWNNFSSIIVPMSSSSNSEVTSWSIWPGSLSYDCILLNWICDFQDFGNVNIIFGRLSHKGLTSQVWGLELKTSNFSYFSRWLQSWLPKKGVNLARSGHNLFRNEGCPYSLQHIWPLSLHDLQHCLLQCSWLRSHAQNNCKSCRKWSVITSLWTNSAQCYLSKCTDSTRCACWCFSKNIERILTCSWSSNREMAAQRLKR